MNTEQQLLDQAIARVEERAEALAALHKLPGLKQTVSVAVTLDGAFDVAAQLIDDEENHGVACGIFQNAMVAVLRNCLALAGVTDDNIAPIGRDVLAVIQERRDAQAQIQKLYDGDEE